MTRDGFVVGFSASGMRGPHLVNGRKDRKQRYMGGGGEKGPFCTRWRHGVASPEGEGGGT